MCTNEIRSYPLNDPFDLLRIVHEITTEFDHNDIWWRGHRSSSWKLSPFVYRDNHPGNYEQNIAHYFRIKSPAMLSDSPDSDIDWLFLMQHSGLPTRLLDWTQSPLIAMFFAVSQDAPDPATLWALNPKEMARVVQNQNGIPIPTDLTVTKIAEAAFYDTPCMDIVIPVMPKYLDYRMLSQRSCFTLHGTKTPIEELEHAKKFLTRVHIPPGQREEMRVVLAQMAISLSYIFPDIENLARELKDFTFDEVIP